MEHYKKDFIIGCLIDLFLFFLTPKQNLNLIELEKNDLKLLKREIFVLKFRANKTILSNPYQPSIYSLVETGVKQENSTLISINIKTKKPVSEKNLIFVEDFQIIQAFPT